MGYEEIRKSERDRINYWIKMFQKYKTYIQNIKEICGGNNGDNGKIKIKKELQEYLINYKLTYLITGKYGIGKSFFIDSCLKDKEDKGINIKYLNNESLTIKEIDEEYKRLNKNDNINNYIDYLKGTFKNGKTKYNNINILVIDQNKYYSLIENKQTIKYLINLNIKIRNMLIILICEEEQGLDIYKHINNVSNLLKLSPLTNSEKLEIFKGQFNVVSKDLINSTDNLNILKTKLKMFNSGNKRCYNNFIKDAKSCGEMVNLNLDKFNNSKFKHLKDLVFKDNIIENLSRFKHVNKDIKFYLQENFNPLLVNNNENRKIIYKLNKSLILNNKFKDLTNVEQNWYLQKYNFYSSFLIPMYYLNNANIKSNIFDNLVYQEYPKVLLLLIQVNKNINIYNELILKLPDNIRYMRMIYLYILNIYQKVEDKNQYYKMVNGFIKYYNLNNIRDKHYETLEALTKLFKNKKTLDKIIRTINKEDGKKFKINKY